MDIISICNGLGNQMSQYALYLNKKQQKQKVACLMFNTGHNGVELEQVFGIKIPKSPFYYLFKCINFALMLDVWRKSKSRLITRLLDALGIRIYFESGKYSFNATILNSASGGVKFLCGGWHNPLYFNNIKEILQSTYKLQLNDKRNIEIEKSISDFNSVAVHIRGGDYIDDVHYDVFGAVCSRKYYYNAISYIETIIQNPIYYVFTNDENFAKRLLGNKECIFITHNIGKDSWKDMALMSKFKNIIIANSTFSWWAAYLGQNNKCVLRPPVFINGDKTSSEIYPHEWIEIDNT